MLTCFQILHKYTAHIRVSILSSAKPWIHSRWLLCDGSCEQSSHNSDSFRKSLQFARIDLLKRENKNVDIFYSTQNNYSVYDYFVCNNGIKYESTTTCKKRARAAWSFYLTSGVNSASVQDTMCGYLQEFDVFRNNRHWRGIGAYTAVHCTPGYSTFVDYNCRSMLQYFLWNTERIFPNLLRVQTVCIPSLTSSPSIRMRFYDLWWKKWNKEKTIKYFTASRYPDSLVINNK